MAPFTTKPLSTLTVGEQLRSARSEAELELSLLAHQLGVHVRYLRALEEDHHQDLPGDVYVRQWLRRLARSLGLNSQQLIGQWFEERRRVATTTKAVPRLVATTTQSHLKRRAWWGVATLAGVTILFLGVRLYAVVAAPSVTLATPTDEITHLQDVYSVTVRGQTTAEAAVSINDQTITADSQGWFQYDVGLKSGINILTLTVHTKHSLSRQISRTVVVAATAMEPVADQMTPQL